MDITSSVEPQPPVLIVPHIDFRINLQYYVETYSRLYQASKFPELVIILGVGHRCPHEFSVHPFGLDTPLGIIAPDLEAWNFLNDHCNFELSRSPESFEGEHSLEFVASWLEVIHELNFAACPYRVLPILCGGLFENLYLNTPPDEHDNFFMLGRALRSLVDSRPAGSTLMIASIDGCHVGPRFGHHFGGNRATQWAVQQWESDLWRLARTTSYHHFFHHLAALTNMFHFDGVGVLSLLLQHFPYQTHVQDTACWFEASDQSFVTFSSGWMK
ncbi:MAG: AmmeMemoRadiSam system protein B [Verrucomicrobiota bacterium]